MLVYRDYYRDDLLKVLVWLEREGHRTLWNDLSSGVARLDEDELREYRASLADDEEAYRVDTTVKYRSEAGRAGILAFDLCRYDSLCRWGNLCGYLSDAEAWALIMPAAANFQASFPSWAELGKSYLIGREFWSHDQTLIDGEAMVGVYMRLLTDLESPWVLNPWDLDLGLDVSGSAGHERPHGA